MHTWMECTLTQLFLNTVALSAIAEDPHIPRDPAAMLLQHCASCSALIPVLRTVAGELPQGRCENIWGREIAPQPSICLSTRL